MFYSYFVTSYGVLMIKALVIIGKPWCRHRLCLRVLRATVTVLYMSKSQNVDIWMGGNLERDVLT
uniref:Uncharacterized protein n=1 Tax=Anguilla anguilla TaxID=7936 RepID=A0A0E9XNU2_ANGAN